jgi:hypothetical protein
MKTRLTVLALVTAATLLSGCATVGRKETALAIARYGTDATVVGKVEQGRPLVLTDLEELGRRKVPDGIILDYLRQREDFYRLTSAQVVRLREAGLGDPVVDYLLASRERAAWLTRRIYPTYGYAYHGSFGRYPGLGHGYGGYGLGGFGHRGGHGFGGRGW